METARSPRSATTAAPAARGGGAAGDVDGDGRPDLVVAYDGHGISVLLNRGDGTFAPPIVVARSEKVFSVAAGDLNGDGRVDVLAQTAYGSTHAPLLGLPSTR